MRVIYIGILLLLGGFSSMALASNWSHCAQEGEICRVPYATEVRYGTNKGHYNTQKVRSQIRCNNEKFGDPAYNQRKQCEYKIQQGVSRWIRCASEGANCHVPYATRVRYEVKNHYNYQKATHTIRCNNKTFGDPAHGQSKHCEYQTQDTRQHSNHSKTNNKTKQNAWTHCAQEDGVCRLPKAGQVQVRYGANGHYNYLQAKGSIRCNNQTFGDPVRNQRKSCAYRLHP